MIIAIHQPNYLPWAGYFYKILHSDLFVFLDSVESSKISYVKRTLFKTAQNEKYLTVPVGKKNIPINQILLPKGSEWKIKQLNFLEDCLRKKPFFEDYYPEFKDIYIKNNEKFLSSFNMNLINYIMKKMQITTKTYISSELDCDSGARNERLVNICNFFDAQNYLSGNGAKQYIDNDLFLENNIRIKYSEFKPNSDLTNYSILHTIFANGYERTRELLMEKNIKSTSK
tara:strand:+ start:776 stop:1459 length:684 start_codon:yes stop_codon:yes gene_type:complete